MTCLRCKANFVLNYTENECIDKTTDINSGKKWLAFCRVLSVDGAECAECEFPDLIDIHQGTRCAVC